MRFTLATLLLFTATIATLLGVSLGFWKPAHPNHVLFLGLYLLATITALIAALHPQARCRAGFTAAAIFGACYLAFGLRGGFDVHLLTDAEWFAGNARLGIALLICAFLLGQLISTICWPAPKTQP